MAPSLTRCRDGELPLLTADQGRGVAAFFRAEISATTAQVYARALCRFLEALPAYGVTALDDLTSKAAAAYFEDLAATLAPATVRQHLAAVNRCLDVLARAGLLSANPARSVQSPRRQPPENTRPTLTDTAITKMLRLIPDDLLGLRDRALLTLLMCTGERITALLALDVTAIQVGEGTASVHFPGLGGTRQVPLPAKAAAALSAYLTAANIQEGALLRSSGWPRRDRRSLGDERLTRNGAWRRIKFLAGQAGVAPPSSHAFRRKTLTALSRSGLGLEEVRQFAGHRSTETTRAYTAATPLKPARILARLHCEIPPPALRQKLPAGPQLRRLLAPWLTGNTLTIPHDERAQVTALIKTQDGDKRKPP